jgi:hypothetical protein
MYSVVEDRGYVHPASQSQDILASYFMMTYTTRKRRKERYGSRLTLTHNAVSTKYTGFAASLHAAWPKFGPASFRREPNSRVHCGLSAAQEWKKNKQLYRMYGDPGCGLRREAALSLSRALDISSVQRAPSCLFLRQFSTQS